MRTNDDLRTNACCCGSPIPPLLEGLTVLDLGCGTGRDVYIASRLVGETGHVIGVAKDVCGNTFSMVAGTRFAPYFTLTGDRSTRLGKFEGCGDKTSDEGCGCGSINEVKNPSVHEI